MNRMKKARKECGLSQKELAQKTGISQQAISYYEIEEREPNIAAWKQIAKALNVSPAYLTGLDDETVERKSRIKSLPNAIFEANGSDLLHQAIADWEQFNDGEDAFADWFPECTWIHADRTYRFGSDLEGITEVSK